MRVLHINSNYLLSQLHQLMVEQLDALGYDNQVFVPIYSGADSIVQPNSNVCVRECFHKNDRFLFDYKQSKIIRAVQDSFSLRSFDIIHAYTLFTDGNCAMQLAKKYHKPFVVAVRNVDVNTFFRYMPFLRSRGVEIMRRASKIFFLSETYCKQVFDRYVPEKYHDELMEKVCIIPNGIDDFWLKSKPEALRRAPADEIRLIYAGTIDRNKNIPTTQRAVRILKERGIHAHLTVVGRVLEKAEFERIQPDENTTYIPAQPKEKLLELYRQHDMFVMPSYTESFGLVYAEAMSQGLPVIYSKGQGFDGQFEEGAVGYHVDARSEVEVADTVQRILENYDAIRKNCVTAARKFDWSQLALKYDGVYREISERLTLQRSDEFNSGKPRRVLLIAKNLLPNLTANGVCACSIASEYVKEGHFVCCIASREPGQAEYEEIDGIHIYRVKSDWFASFQQRYANGSKLEKLYYKAVHVLRNGILIPFYPDVSPLRSKKVFRQADKIIRQEKIDTVIGFYRPYEAIYTALHIKKKYKENIYCVSYYLDMLLQKKSLQIGKSFNSRRCLRSQWKDIHTLDKVIIPAANQAEFEEMFGKNENVEFLDFPMYIKEKNSPAMDLPFQPEALNLAYVGTLNCRERSPEKLLELLDAVQTAMPNIRLHVWGNIDHAAMDLLKKYPNLAEHHGYVNSQSVSYILENADWVVNISNQRNSNMIPSKIFQLFASGKPVLNYVFNNEDKSLPYFERYKSTYTVYDDEADRAETVDALGQALQKEWPSVNADDAFRENTPAYVAEKILR